VKRLLRLFFGCLGFILLAGIVVAVRQPKPVVSGPLTLPDGSVVRIVGVTYGTNHFLGRPLARFVAHMPAGAQGVLQRLLGSQAVLRASATTFEPSLIVWLARATNNAATSPNSGYLSAFLSDSSGFISGDSAPVYVWWSNPQQWEFQVFPRRDPVIVLNFFYHNPTGGVTRCGSLPFANPLRGNFPRWQPEALPATRRAGEVAVTLDKVSTGHDGNTSYRSVEGGGEVIQFGTNRADGRNETVCAVHLHSLTNTNEVWVVADEEVSDATGNRARNMTLGWGSSEDGYFALRTGWGRWGRWWRARRGIGSSEDGYFTFGPGLWPNESAWKLRCEIKRAKGFAAGETFSFRDVPLGRLDETNRLGWTTNFAGVTVTLDYVVRRAPNTNSSWSSRSLSQAQFSTAGLTNGVHLDLVSARTDTGTKLDSPSWSSGGNLRSYSFRNLPRDARTADFTFAVQRSLWVEFVVKPEAGPFCIEYKPER
jgi:hypothetical protein